MFHNLDEARREFAQHRKLAEANGVVFLPETRSYLPEAWKRNYEMACDQAMDAQPSLTLTSSAAIPWFLLNYTDPKIYKVLFAKVTGAKILGERRVGDWKMATSMFPVVEHTGNTASYGDYNNSGMSNANTNFPERQNYRFQTIKAYGELELEQAGAARINWAAELDASAAGNMMKMENTVYYFGVAGLQNYGIVNDPNLGASLTPAPKAYGGTTWFVGTVLKATPNEVYNDVLSLYYQAVSQGAGQIDEETKFTLALSPTSAVAFKAANSFGVNTYELLEENLPNLRIEKGVQFGALTASNPQGVAAGNFMMLIADEVDGQKQGECAYSEKLRSHPIIRELSAFKQKISAGAWGAIYRSTLGVTSMVGI